MVYFYTLECNSLSACTSKHGVVNRCLGTGIWLCMGTASKIKALSECKENVVTLLHDIVFLHFFWGEIGKTFIPEVRNTPQKIYTPS